VTNIVVTQPTLVTATTTIVSDFFGMPVSCVGATDGIVDANAVGGTPGYTYSWNSTPVQTTMQATDLGVGLYTVVVTDLNGCTASTDVYLDANPLPELNLPDKIYGCMGNGVLLDSQAEPGSSCTWTFSDGQVLNECGPFIANFANQDCYDLQLTVINAQGCINSASITDFVCIMPNPLAGFYADEYTVSNVESGTNFWNTSQGAESYLWVFGDGSAPETTENVYHEFGPGDDFVSTNFPVTLFAISEYGCIDSATLYITMNPELIFYVPNAFTPDGDDYNNVFKPVFSSGYDLKNYDLMIFNRWGELIFETDQIGQGWDGTYRGNMCQDGVYTWKLKVMNSVTDRKEEHVGHVSLLRGEGLK
jgi:gliding motility-associated-like protein